MDIRPEAKVESVTRVAGGLRVTGYVDVDGAGQPIPPMPFAFTLKDSLIRRAVHAVADEARRFKERIFGKGKKKK